MSFTYILYSQSFDKYYIGSTSGTLEDRLRRHLSNHSGFTGKAKDWKIVYSKEFLTIKEARSFEKKIKKMKSRNYIEKLIKEK